MIRHAYFDLWLHTNDELSAYLGLPIIERATLHEWPLSCVQRIVTADRHRRIYKTQAASTVEHTFYAAARSKLLVKSDVVEYEPSIMFLEFVDAPTPSNLSEPEAVQLANQALAEIRRIEGDPPVWLDIGSAEKWRAAVSDVADTLRTLVAKGDFTRVNESAVERLENCALKSELLDAANIDPGLVHGDLYAENLFLLPDGALKVIDWARPYRGPAELDRVTLMESFGVVGSVDPVFVTMSNCLRIHWLAGCAERWFPPGIQTYDEQIADLIEKLI
jgi:hypothetical protein